MFVSIVCKLQCIVPTVYKRLSKHLRKQAVREAATTCPRPVQVEFCPFDLESGVRVTCDVSYLCANFSLLWPLCSRLRPDVGLHDRQTSVVRRASSLNALGAGV